VGHPKVVAINLCDHTTCALYRRLVVPDFILRLALGGLRRGYGGLELYSVPHPGLHVSTPYTLEILVVSLSFIFILLFSLPRTAHAYMHHITQRYITAIIDPTHILYYYIIASIRLGARGLE
jgi:hypothetical protein